MPKRNRKDLSNETKFGDFPKLKSERVSNSKLMNKIVNELSQSPKKRPIRVPKH